MRRFALTAAVLVLLGVAVPATASALTRKQANAVALRVLHAKAGKKNVILFGLPRPLKAGSSVIPADPPKLKPGPKSVKVRKRRTHLKHATWLFWLDQVPYAKFSHRSRYLLVDDATGKVLKNAGLRWYPSVNGKRPTFVDPKGYRSKRYRVYTRFARPKKRAAAATAPYIPLTWPLANIPPGALKGECILIVSDYADPQNQNDWDAFREWGLSMKIQTFFAAKIPVTGASGEVHYTPQPGNVAPDPKGEPPDSEALRDNTTDLIANHGCTDIVIYLAGHGLSAEEADQPFVIMRDKVTETDDGELHELTGIDAGDIATDVDLHPGTDFKLKVDACYSGRFRDALTDVVGGQRKSKFKNLIFLENSSAAGQISSFADPLVDGNDNPNNVSEFTNQNLTGLTKFFDSQTEIDNAVAQGGSLMAHALDRAFDLGADVNHAVDEDGDKIDPQRFTNFGLPKPDLKYIGAVFPTQPFTTTYTATDSRNKPLVGQGLTFVWTVVMQADFGCSAGFKPNSPNPNQASWYHADVSEGGPCNHFGTDHPGTVYLVVSNTDWVCTALYQGTLGGQGPAAPPCQRK